MKPIESLVVNGVGWFRSTHRSVVLLSAQTRVPSSRTLTDPDAVGGEIRALCEALIVSPGHLGS
jgi:hypothetical protein